MTIMRQEPQLVVDGLDALPEPQFVVDGLSGGFGADAAMPTEADLGMTGEQFAWHLAGLLGELDWLDREFPILLNQCLTEHGPGASSEALEMVTGISVPVPLCRAGQVDKYATLISGAASVIALTDLVLTPQWRSWVVDREHRDPASIAYRVSGLWMNAPGAVQPNGQPMTAAFRAGWAQKVQDWYKLVADFVTGGSNEMQADLNYRYEAAVEEMNFWDNLSILYDWPIRLIEAALHWLGEFAKRALAALGDAAAAVAGVGASALWAIIKPLLLPAALVGTGLVVYYYRQDIADTVSVKVFKRDPADVRAERVSKREAKARKDAAATQMLIKTAGKV